MPTLLVQCWNFPKNKGKNYPNNNEKTQRFKRMWVPTTWEIIQCPPGPSLSPATTHYCGVFTLNLEFYRNVWLERDSRHHVMAPQGHHQPLVKNEWHVGERSDPRKREVREGTVGYNRWWGKGASTKWGGHQTKAQEAATLEITN